MYVVPEVSYYDAILGRDFLQKVGFFLDFNNQLITWNDVSTSMKKPKSTNNFNYAIEERHVLLQNDNSRLQRILDANYEKANLNEIVQECTHLNEIKRKGLNDLLNKFEQKFDGQLGQWTGKPYEIELKAGATPYHSRPFALPKCYEKTLRKEVERLCKIGVLRRVNCSEWGAPTFIIPKKDQTVRFISDFCKLNKHMKCKPYPIPRIQDF